MWVAGFPFVLAQRAASEGPGYPLRFQRMQRVMTRAVQGESGHPSTEYGENGKKQKSREA